MAERDYGKEWRGEPSVREWQHLCMGSDGCLVKEEGTIRDHPRRIAYPIAHVDAEEITTLHNKRLSDEGAASL